MWWNSRERRPRAVWRLLLFVATAALVANPLVLVLDQTDSTLLEGSLENVCIALGFFAALVVSTRYIDRRPLRDFGFAHDKAWWEEFGIGFGIGGAIAACVFGVQFVAGWVTIEDITWTALGIPFVVAFGGQLLRYAGGSLFEELTTRSYLLRMIAEFASGLGVTRHHAVLISWLVTSVVFGALHFGNPGANAELLGNLALLGLLFGLPMVLTGRLAASIGMHMGWNVLLNNVFGLPNSGQAALTTVLATEVSGPTQWTGGAAGPEGSLLTPFAVLLGVAMVIVWQRARGTEGAALELADPPSRSRG